LFLGVGIWAKSVGEWWAIGLIVLSVFSFLVVLYSLLPGKAFKLIVDSSGLEMKSPFKSMKLAWRDVDGFYVGSIQSGLTRTKLVAIKYADSYDKQRTGRKVSASFTGLEGALPNHFKKSPEELCEILNSYKQKYDPSSLAS
jgi:hypothetical protein